ncbi:MAG TPA: alpha/beta hydrolase, partial [Thermomicrobiaceae bacterium]|nr:alpha/beta hydrolase [Thermomicrobiaceae bacterium]
MAPGAADGLGFIHQYVAPSPATKAAPTMLLLHGTGGSERDLLDLGRVLRPGAGLLSPRGKVSEQGAARYFRRLREGVFDTNDLIYRTSELASFVRQAARVYGFDLSQVIAAGYSNGANIAGSLLLLQRKLLAAAVLYRPMVPLVPDPLPNLQGKPVYIGAGRSDPLVSPSQTEALAELLQRCGANVDLHWQEAGHALVLEDIQSAAAWMQGV